MYIVRGFKLHSISRAQQNRVYGFHGVGANFIT